MQKLKCKYCEFTTNDILNKSGILGKHLKSVHANTDKSKIKDSFELIEVEETKVELFHCPYCDWTSKDLNNSSGWFTTHIKKHNLTPEQHIVNYPKHKILWKLYFEQLERDQFINDSSEHRIKCEICGELFKKISNSHLKKHGITIEEYKKKYNVKNTASKATCEKQSIASTKENTIHPVRKSNRNIGTIQCEICNNTFATVGFATHLKDTHKLSTYEYATIYGEYRKNQLTRNARLNRSKIKCVICDQPMISDRSLGLHVQSKHNMSKIDYIKKFIFNNEIQMCKCGCGQEVSYLSVIPYRSMYISGHNPNGMTGKTHSDESKLKMKQSAINRFDTENLNRSNTKPELEFKTFLDINTIDYIQQYKTEFGIIDFYLPDLDRFVEIDGIYWHPIIKENLNMQQFKNMLGEYVKYNNIPNLIRIKDSDISKLTCINDIIKYNYKPSYSDYIITPTTIIMSKDYIEYYKSIATEKEMRKRINYFVDFFFLYFEFEIDKTNILNAILDILGYNSTNTSTDLTIDIVIMHLY